MRTSRKRVTFRRPFSLSGIDEVQPAGTYMVETSEELIEGLSFPVWRRTIGYARCVLSRRPACRPQGRRVFEERLPVRLA